jgi:thiosulfate dehydrogenase [quinone] large subunit
VGHIVPVAFLRIFLGYYYFGQALELIRSEYLSKPLLAAHINEALARSVFNGFYQWILESLIVSQWEYFAGVLVTIYFAIGASYILGYLVRPIALLASFLALNSFFLGLPEQEIFFKVLLSVHIMLAWIGAGRCLGIDYFFYKKQRGLWW